MQKISKANFGTCNFAAFTTKANYIVWLLRSLGLQEYGPGFQSPEPP